jgi:two-component system chemotaxis response regulator CheB
MARTRDVIVIGSSMGGLNALMRLVEGLPADLPTTVLVVQHISAESPGLLSQLLDGRGPLPAVTAADGMQAKPGRIHVAPPDRHMLLTPAGIRITFGPRENLSRPAIDPLFRTAAVHYRSRVIGVVLSGMLGDGASGLAAVKACGGIAVVQAPEDAAYPEMPRNAIAAVDVDYQTTLADLAGLLARLAREEAPAPPDVSERLLIEARLTESTMSPSEWSDLPGRPSPFVCPECGGHLREIESDDVRRYRCHVGHAFSAEVLEQSQGQAVEDALWIAMRTLEERARMLETMSHDEARNGRVRSAASFDDRAREARAHEDAVRALLGRLTPRKHATGSPASDDS